MKIQRILRPRSQGNTHSRSNKIAPRKIRLWPQEPSTRYFIEFIGRGSSLSSGSLSGFLLGSLVGIVMGISGGGIGVSSSASASSGSASSSSSSASSSSSGSSSPIGHAFVKWIKVDAGHRVSHEEASGFYSNGQWFINVPGSIRSDDNKTGLVSLRLEVAESQYKRTIKIKEEWRRKADAGELKYDLGGANCIDFADKIARDLGLRVPSYDSAWEIRNLFRLPVVYVAELLELNRYRNVPSLPVRP